MFGSLPEHTGGRTPAGDASVSSWTQKIWLQLSQAQFSGTGLSTVNLTTLPNLSNDMNPDPAANIMSPLIHPPSSGNPDP